MGRWGVVCCALIARVGSASAEPDWATELRRKADDYERTLRRALARLEHDARGAAVRLDADVRARLDELTALLDAHASAAAELLRAQAGAYHAIAAARLGEAAAVASQLERELAEIRAGARTRLDVDRRRLVSGAQQVVTAALGEAGVIVSQARIVDGELVVRAVAETTAEARRWMWLVFAGGGLIAAAGGIGLVWPRRLAGDRAARRWISSAIGIALVGGGGVAIGLGVHRWRAPAPAEQIRVGIPRCDALADAQRLIEAGRASSAARAGAQSGLQRCLVLIADAGSAELVADRLLAVRRLPVVVDGGGGNP